MSKTRVLYVTNSHPDIYLGGVEVYAYELYKSVRALDEYEPIFLARTFAPGHETERPTPFRAHGEDPMEVLWFSEHHDYFLSRSPNKQELTRHFRDFLLAYRPDLVHIQHTMGLGVDLIRQVKTTLPNAPIVYTLHELLPICNARGFMVKTTTEELCYAASPAACHQCFPDYPTTDFLLRERFIKSHLENVDLFLAPSRFLRQRFVEWGIPAERIRFLDYGRAAPACAADFESDEPPVSHFAFLGQLAPHKGLLVLLDAMKMVIEEGVSEAHLFLNGANFERQPESFREQVTARLAECSGNVTLLGKYAPSEVSDRLLSVAWVVVPSLWWENSPLVVQEAFMHHRPVICSGVGGMAEKVTEGVDGLHFRIGDAKDLAAVMKRVARSPEEWRRLRSGIAPVYSMEESVEAHREIYGGLLASRGRMHAESSA